MPVPVRLFIDPRGAASLHLTQLFTGFAVLAREGRAAVTVDATPPHPVERPGHILWADVDGHRLVYDTRDSSEIGERELAWGDRYFKRSCPLPPAEAPHEKVEPLGLNYVVHTRGDWRTRRAAWALRRLRRPRPADLLDVLASAAGLTTTGSRLLRMNGGPATSTVEQFEAPPGTGEPRAVLLTQTYDPVQMSSVPEQQEGYRQLNEGRAAVIRALRAALGERVVAGFGPSRHARLAYPDCVADGAVTRKASYLELVKQSWIGVATVGLHDSTGWRVAEYTAASRAIVTTPVRHRVPGSFEEGRNYLTFDDPADAAAAVERILTDGELRRGMMEANHTYYRGFVRPDALVARTLSATLGRPLGGRVDGEVT